MTKSISPETLSAELFAILEETFETHHGIYLDRGTSLFETLAGVSATEASVPVGGRCATIAAQVEHVIFYLDVLERYITGQEVGDVDWGEIWERVGAVTSGEWDDLRARLEAAYAHLCGLLRGIDHWELEESIGGSLAIVVHTAYHLGEIRQALCTVGRFEE